MPLSFDKKNLSVPLAHAHGVINPTYMVTVRAGIMLHKMWKWVVVYSPIKTMHQGPQLI